MPSIERCEYLSQSGSIPGVVLYRTERLAFVQFETREWPGYREYGYYAIVGIFGQRTTEASSSDRSEVSKAPVVSGPRPEKNGSNKSSKGKLDGKEVRDGVRFPTRRPPPVRSLEA